jgi:hypothetical protein
VLYYDHRLQPKEANVQQVLGVDVQPTAVKEPVMNVAAIDMTDAATRAKRTSSPARKKNAKPAKTAKTKAQPKRTRDGSVGRDTFEQVEALLRQGKNKSEAFKQIAGETGRNTGTVSANYYRVARASGAVKPQQRRAKAAPASGPRGRQRAAQSVSRGGGARTGNGGGSVDQIVGQLVASVQALTEAIQAQDAEVAELRRRLDGVRSLLG